MRRYEWYSELPPEQVRARLTVRAGPWKGAWARWDERRTWAKLLPEGRFYLLRTGGTWQTRTQSPFVGRVSPWGDGSLIAGEFRPPKSTWIVLAVLGGAAFAAALSVPAPAGLVCVLLWLGAGVGMLHLAGGDGSRETLAFIEENLLRE